MRETGIEEGRGEGKGERSIFESSGTGMKTVFWTKEMDLGRRGFEMRGLTTNFSMFF